MRIAAPLGGTLKAHAGGELREDQAVRAGQPVFELTPLLTPDGRATLSAALAGTTGHVNTARAAFDLADIAVKRAERVLKEGPAASARWARRGPRSTRPGGRSTRPPPARRS